IPGVPRPSPVAGLLSAKADAAGTLTPWTIRTQGQGQLVRLKAGQIPLGDVPFRWATQGDDVVVTARDAHPFGGRLSAEARVPIVAGKPTKGSAWFTGIDTAALTASLPGDGLKLTGKANGKVAMTMPPGAPIEATVSLAAPDLTVQGLPAE